MILGAGLWLSSSLAMAAGPPITDYTVYGLNGVKIGAGSVVAGLTGAQNNGANGAAIKMNGGSSVVGDVRSGDDVSLANVVTITGTLFRATGTNLAEGSGTTIGGGDVVGDAPAQLVFPSPSAFPCPSFGPNFNFANSATLTIGPGTYGDLSAGGLFTLNLSAGNYFFNSISTGNGATINVTSAPVHVFVCGSATFGSAEMLPTSLTSNDVSFEVQAVGAGAFRASGSSRWIGDVFAPNGEIGFGGSGCCSSFLGHLWAGANVDIQHGVSGSSSGFLPPPPPPLPPKDSTILHGNQNTNNGANNTVRVQYQVSGIFGFDVARTNFPGVTNAYLVLHVQNRGLDDPPSNWPGGAGDLIKAYRMSDGLENWAEGNGFNFPTVVYRGDGNGVTWNCVTDTNITNVASDCSGPTFWDSGGQNFQGPARSIAAVSPNLKIANNMTDGSEIWFDVTADVQAGLGPKDTNYMSWFVRKPSGAGFVSFYSREGAATIGNPAWAPQLVILP
jgi:hypothetical protein